jgi:predicted Fe-Mo cluster-binding NifX family protein
MIKIAIPIFNSMLSNNFEDCSYYLIYGINLGKIQDETIRVNAQDENLKIDEWIAKWKITDVIANGISNHSISYFSETKINLFIGVDINTPDELIEDYLNGTLKSNTRIVANLNND